QRTVVPTCTFSVAGANLRSFICTLAVASGRLLVVGVCFWALRACHWLLTTIMGSAKASKLSQTAQDLNFRNINRFREPIDQTPLPGGRCLLATLTLTLTPFSCYQIRGAK